MSKSGKIERIKNKILGNIKNKKWFLNYKYKNEKMNGDEYGLYLSFFTMVYMAIFSILSTLTVIKLSAPSLILFTTPVCIGLSFFTSFLLNKFSNKTNKRKTEYFIKESENRDVIDLLEGDERFNNIKKLAKFIKSQPLEKEDIDIFNRLLIDNFDQEELNYVFYNEKLSDILKDSGNVDYDYVICALNLLKKLDKNKYRETIDNNIKNKLFGKKNENDTFKNKKELIEKA